MKNIRFMRVAALAVLLAVSLTACGEGGSEIQSSPEEDEGYITVKMKADFGSSVSSALSKRIQLTKATKKDTCPTPPPPQDEPSYEAGLDCDGDGGVIRYITPSSFKIAFKKITFIKDSENIIEIIPDVGALADAIIYDLTSEITISHQSLPTGNYPSFEADIYYYEIQMEINNPPVLQTLRVYLSDDDFPAEGNLGHHQGDITFIDSDGNEIGWVCEKWEESSLQSHRGDINGGGGTDPETGHLRGLYGCTNLWNQPRFMQGSNQDIYQLSEYLGLTIEDTSKTIIFSFNVKDTWFYEDFDNDQTFNPCDSTYDACSENAAWSPLFDKPDIIIQ